MGWTPDEDRLDVFEFWAGQEGALYAETYNPLATTLPASEVPRSTRDIGFGPGKWNTANPPHGVAIYATPEDGARATVMTLGFSHYVNIRRCFADKKAYPEAVGPRDFTSWVGSEAYGKRVVAFMAERFKAAPTGLTEAFMRQIAREEAEWMVGGLFLPLMMQVLGLTPETFTDNESLEQVRAKLFPGGRVPPHTHRLDLVLTQTGGIQ